ncbi:CDP-glucose 4,6-dehydratase [Candidatus Woesearchaeota archaeon]|nr:CDP-glucose 4,6-dehydratase [Candidatus Woesearchaeota archaeon]
MDDFYKGKKIFVTGHTGFKGSWLSFMLISFGARLSGYALSPGTNPSLFKILGLDTQMKNYYLDIRNYTQLSKAIKNEKPEILFHLAAQPIVRESFDSPVYTFETNVIGTANILECIRQSSTIKSAVIVTTDKVYEIKHEFPYNESDELGGHDPYSASKACAELVVKSYLRSFKNLPSVATARSGNVIGGGDWAEDRLVPDILRHLFEEKDLLIRNPEAIRPWQHVLEPTKGYLQLAKELYFNNNLGGAWNFGPEPDSFVDVKSLIEMSFRILNINKEIQVQRDSVKHETKILRIDNSKAKEKLNWSPKLRLTESLDWTFQWYKCFYNNQNVLELTEKQIKEYIKNDRS